MKPPVRTDDLPLFEPAQFRRRNADPATSHESAVAIEKHLGKMHEAVLAALKQRPYSTAAEIDRAMGRVACAHKRLPELDRRGLVVRIAPRPCIVTGRNAIVWRLA